MPAAVAPVRRLLIFYYSEKLLPRRFAAESWIWTRQSTHQQGPAKDLGLAVKLSAKHQLSDLAEAIPQRSAIPAIAIKPVSTQFLCQVRGCSILLQSDAISSRENC
jgi:hypothetical protein